MNELHPHGTLTEVTKIMLSKISQTQGKTSS